MFKKILCACMLICVILAGFVSCDKSDYNEALELIESGDYEEAYEILKELGDYKDSAELLKNFRFVPSSYVYKELYEGEEYKITASVSLGEGNLPVQVVLIEDGEKYICDYTYDNDGNLIKEVYTDYDGDKSIYDYTYDNYGNLFKKYWSDSEGEYESGELQYRLVYIEHGDSYKFPDLIEELMGFTDF